MSRHMFRLLFALLFCLLASAITGATDYSKQHPLYQRVQSLMAQQQNDQAVVLLDSINHPDPNGLACLQLGQIYTEAGEWEKAETCLKLAKKLKKHYAEAYFALGRLYMEGPFLLEDAYSEFRWCLHHDASILDAHYYKARIRMINRDRVDGLGELEKLMMKNPDHRNAYDLYLRVALTFHEHGKLTSFLPKLIERYPLRPRFVSDLVHAHYLAGEYEKALECLMHYEAAIKKNSTALYGLNLARIKLAMNLPEEGFMHYENGFNAITNRLEATAYFDDVTIIATEFEYNQFQTLADSQFTDFFRCFWKSRDPSLTTDFNERLVEHYQRHRYALDKHRRWPHRQLIEYFTGEQTEPRFLDHLIINRFGKSTAIRRNILIDDMGVIYIRHGHPTRRYLQTDEAFYGCSTWAYEAIDDRPYMVFNFSRIGRTSGMRKKDLGFVLVPEPISNDQQIDDNTLKNILRSVQLGTSTTTTQVAPEKPVDFAWDRYVFREKGDLGHLAFFYELPESMTETLTEDSARIEQTLAVYDGQWREVARSVSIDSSHSLTGKPLRALHIDVKPGTYFAGFEMNHDPSGRQGRTSFVLMNPFEEKWFSMSSIMLGNYNDNVHCFDLSAQEKSLVSHLIPNLQRRFKTGQDLVIYFEIYNMLLDLDGYTDVEVKITLGHPDEKTSLLKRLLRRGKSGTVSSIQTISGQHEDANIFQSVTLPDLKPARYTLKVIVNDKIAKQKIENTLRFEIVK